MSIVSADQFGEARSKRELRLISDTQVMHLPDPEFIIDERLPAHGIVVLAGPTGVGKTFVAIDMALCIATGIPNLGASVRRSGPVVYVAADGSVCGIKARLGAWKREFRYSLVESVGVFVIADAVNLGHAADVNRLIAAIKPVQPVLVIFDTLARSMAGLDENLAKDVNVVVEALDRIIDTTNGAVMVVHHCRPYRRPRARFKRHPCSR
jgi:RecA-family ATPase